VQVEKVLFSQRLYEFSWTWCTLRLKHIYFLDIMDRRTRSKFYTILYSSHYDGTCTLRSEDTCCILCVVELKLSVCVIQLSYLRYSLRIFLLIYNLRRGRWIQLANWLIYARAFVEYVCGCILFQDVTVREIRGR